MMPQGATYPARTKASNVERAVGAFIDGIILVPVNFVLLWIPVAGWVAMAVVGAAWWLLRDAKGFSIGKKVMGLEVVSKNGAPTTEEQLMKRNYTLAGAQACNVIPLFGWMVSFGVFVIETVLLFAKGERYGDEMAGTMVVKKVG